MGELDFCTQVSSDPMGVETIDRSIGYFFYSYGFFCKVILCLITNLVCIANDITARNHFAAAVHN